jgi:hypothetical protein
VPTAGPSVRRAGADITLNRNRHSPPCLRGAASSAVGIEAVARIADAELHASHVSYACRVLVGGG